MDILEASFSHESGTVSSLRDATDLLNSLRNNMLEEEFDLFSFPSRILFLRDL